MPYTIKHDPVLDIVEVTLTGLINGSDLREATTKCTTLQKQTGTIRFLVDANGWDVAASLIDIYDIPAKQYWNEELYRQSRIAVILPTSASAQHAAHFYENACQNRGWNARVCPGRQNALDWLTGHNVSGKSDASNG